MTANLKFSPVGRPNRDWLARSALRHGVAMLMDWMTEHRYAARTRAQYRGIVAHFARWMMRLSCGRPVPSEIGTRGVQWHDVRRALVR